MWGEPGCISGEEIIHYQSRRADGSLKTEKKVTLARFFEVFHRIKGSGKGAYQVADADSEHYLCSVGDDGNIFRNKVTNVIDSGVKECLKVTLSNGESLTATPDHLFLTPDGYVELQNLEPGNSVWLHTNNLVRFTNETSVKPEGRRKMVHVKHHPHGNTHIVRNSSGEYTYKRFAYARLVMEASLNSLSTEEYRSRLNDGTFEGLSFLDPRDDVHHLDEDFTNDNLSNLVVLSHSDHARSHSTGSLKFYATEGHVVSVEPAGVVHTFDVSMEGPVNNFVVNGFAVHNCGKSSIVKQIASSCGLFTNTTIASICEPADIGGYPIPDLKAKVVRPLPAPWIAAVNTKQGCVQFFDEATSCSSAAQSAIMRIVLEGVAGDCEIHPRVRFLSAANPVEMAANANDLEVPLANRFGHLEFDPGSAQGWVEWLRNSAEAPKPVDPAIALALEARVMKEWPAAYGEAVAIVGTFIGRTRPALLHKLPDLNSDHASKAWPSRRSWANATRALASSKIHGLSEIDQNTFISSFVGAGPAGELLAYIKHVDLPNALDLLDGKVTFEPVTARLDRTAAVLESCVQMLRVREENTPEEEALRKKRALECYKILGTVASSKSADLAHDPLRQMMTANRLSIAHLGQEHKGVVLDTLKSLNPIIDRILKAEKI